MKFTKIEGLPFCAECRACLKHGMAGTNSYKSAATGEDVYPDEFYADETDADCIYCGECAAKLVAEDPTKSVAQFYTTTTGEEIDYARLLSED